MGSRGGGEYSAPAHHRATGNGGCGNVTLRMRAVRFLLSVACVVGPAALLASCGGGSGGGPTAPTPTHSVTVTVFYDENADGVMQSIEVGRVPGVEIEIGGRTAVSEKLTGRAVADGVPEGTQQVSVRASTLPAYYRAASTAQSLSVPQPPGADATLALTLDIGGNRPFVYMAFGDSITEGDGSMEHEGGYRGLLQDALRAHFGGAAEIVNEGQSGSKSDVGAERIGASLNRQRPAYTLIMYGTNDYVRAECQVNFPCYTIDALRSMIGAARAARSLAVLATIPPVHPMEAQAGRNGWVGSMNELVRPMARQEGVPVADVYAAFMRAPDLAALFADRLHPNDRGYEIIAAEFLAAVTRPLGASSAAARWPALFLSPGAAAGPRG
jgi:lysophospholipase L1-like esterase